MVMMEMSKTYQYRKVMKPLLERKRRARINKCLDHLKDLMVECLQQDGEHVTRLEKADILELTVEHMRKLKQRGSLALGTPTAASLQLESFRSGYVHAADQISQVLLQQRQPAEIGQKVIAFLSTRLMELQNQILTTSTQQQQTGIGAGAAFHQLLPASVLISSPLSSSLSTPTADLSFSEQQQLRQQAISTPRSYSLDLSDLSSDGIDSKSKSYSVHDGDGDGEGDDDDDNDDDIEITEDFAQPSSSSSSSSMHSDASNSEPMWRPW